MSYRLKVMIIGDSTNIKTFAPLFQMEGVEVVSTESINAALEKAKETRPKAIVFVVPVYWASITHFVEEIRKLKGFDEIDVPIFYLGSVIEGEDQKILQRYGVKVLTFGPVPKDEVVRYILNEIQ